MAFKRGQSGNPQGKPKGAVNKATQDARQAIALFVDNNAHRLEGWLDKVAVDNPAKAFELFQSVVEYHIPKLARQDNTSSDGTMTPKSIPVEFIQSKRKDDT